jgi:hypothetical protein
MFGTTPAATASLPLMATSVLYVYTYSYISFQFLPETSATNTGTKQVPPETENATAQ